MSLLGFVKKNLMDYFIIVTGINVAIAVLGMNFDPDTVLGYEAYFSPLIIGAVAVLPSMVLYSRRELSVKGMLFRRALHLLVLELTLISFGYVAGLLTQWTIVLPFVVVVLVVYVFTLLVHYLIDSRTAVEINKGLRRIQE
ncbi:MAG: hypothetical protein H6Q59_1061 [Firmicutes bacterium]|nr:hypothetical protein [Bacillota bacterium]